MATEELQTAAAAAWAEALGCDLRLLDEPGGHLVPGGARLRELNGVYLASLRDSVLVYCPGWLQPRAAAVLASTPPGQLFSRGTCARIADFENGLVFGPSWHGFTRPAARGRGLATRIAVQMISDALPAAGIIRYRALVTNSPSLAIARSLGFVGCGQNLIARLPA
jgi:hypothetical protein